MSSTHLSRLRIALRTGVQRNVAGQEGELQELVEVLVRQGRLWYGNFRLFHTKPSLRLPYLDVLPQTGIASFSDLLIVNQKRNMYVSGAVSRTLSIPSVSSTSVQVCNYHIHNAFSRPDQNLDSSRYQKNSMAMSTAGTAVGGCYNNRIILRQKQLLSPISNGSNTYLNRNSASCRKSHLCLNKLEQNRNYYVYTYFIHNSTKRWCNSGLIIRPGSRCVHSSCLSADTAQEMSFDHSSREEQPSSSEQKIPAGRTLKLVSGSCYLPHPDKEQTGGEDAHFICADEQAIGVADGVGGWGDVGVDAGLYSRELMSNSIAAVQEEPKGAVDPARVLEKAHSRTKAKGSSTACIIALTDQGVRAINLGDSGFLIVRDGCTILRSLAQQHNFNFTYQLESGEKGDQPKSGQVFTVPVIPGDVIIAGTDGLFDNLYTNDIIAAAVHSKRAGFGPQMTAQKIAALARQRAQDKNRQTPFSSAAQDAGYRYYGGKLDDITVVVSHILNSDGGKRAS